jgi:hydrogenase maturation protease
VLTIVGCGNLNRSDDGVGIVVAHKLIEYLRHRSRPDVQVFDAGTAGLDVMFRARGARRLVLIDANRSGSEPGAVFRVPGEELEKDYQPAYSLHDFRWDHALYAGRRIFGATFPTDVTVFLIEIATIELGTELSEPVAMAAERVVRDLQTLIDQHCESTDATDVATQHNVRIARSNIYIDSKLCAEFLGNAVSIAALNTDGRALLLPLQGSSAGGLLLKVLNSRGDRVVHAPEFLRALGFDFDSPERSVQVRWSAEAAALILEGLLPTAN